VIICIGNALVDSLTQITESKIEELNLNKARMTLVDKERSNFLLQNMESPIYEAGGSAANTAYWISQLGGEAGFIGKISDDDLGKQFQTSLKESGLKDLTVFETEDNQTGNKNSISNAKILYMEGYLWDKPSSKEAFIHAAKINKETDGLNAISLSDVFCVDMHRESFIEFIKSDINYVFCNEDELNALFELNKTTEAIEHFEKTFPNVNQLVCTLGADGVLILDKGKKYNFKATEAKVIDKTGAGDFFAAGYLFGLQKGFSIVESAEIANKSAAHVISEVGVRPKKEFT
jgi:fructokinase